MDKLQKIQQKLHSLIDVQRQIKSNQTDRGNVISMFEDELTVYEQAFYGESVDIFEIKGCIERLEEYKRLPKLSEYDTCLLIDPERLVGLDVDSCSITIDTKYVPEPYEDCDYPETTITISGYVKWTEEQKEQEKIRLQEELMCLKDKEKFLVGELKELGVDVL